MMASYYQKLDPERKKAYLERVRRWAEANPTKVKAAKLKWKKANKLKSRGNLDKYKARIKRWKLNHPERLKGDPEKARERLRRWKKSNKDKNAAESAKRRAAKLLATPIWANQNAIKNIYKEALIMSLEVGITYHVDHIIPLRSMVVCGLHVEHNLQILSSDENVAKSNKLLDCK